VKTNCSGYPLVVATALKAWQAKHDPGPETVRYFVCVLCGFWRVCAHKRCRRARKCSGDPRACFEQHWRQVPEVAKVRYRALIAASQARAGARGG
jgi:hypothetical protein